MVCLAVFPAAGREFGLELLHLGREILHPLPPIRLLPGIGGGPGQAGQLPCHALQSREGRRQFRAFRGGAGQAISPQHHALPGEQFPIGRFRILAAVDRQSQISIEIKTIGLEHRQLLPLRLDYRGGLDVPADNRHGLAMERFGLPIVALVPI